MGRLEQIPIPPNAKSIYCVLSVCGDKHKVNVRVQSTQLPSQLNAVQLCHFNIQKCEIDRVHPGKRQCLRRVFKCVQRRNLGTGAKGTGHKL
ncbi:hypothetical protein SDC9_105096 [bioreactor metagenome]|uniref:Uncharacterized protein n=1 Tax=bioreactor metagenome TaxID=1076179 RepID=A0A645AYE4_9ZZZZ